MATSEEIKLIIRSEMKGALADYTKLNKKMGATGKNVNSLSGSLTKMKGSWLAVSGIVAGYTMIMNKAVKAASALAEEQSKFNVVFGTSDKILKKANVAVSNLANNYAMSRREAIQSMAAMQDLLKPLGIAPEKAANLSETIIQLSADMGSFSNMDSAAVMNDIQSALVGMNRPMMKYGTVLSAATIKQEALNMGLFKGKGEISASARAQAALNLIIKSQSDAIGDTERNQNSYAIQLKRTNARIEDFLAGMGTPFMETMANAMGAMNASSESALAFGASVGMVISTLGTLSVEVVKALGEWSGINRNLEILAKANKELAKQDRNFLGLGKARMEQTKAQKQAQSALAKAQARASELDAKRRKQSTDNAKKEKEKKKQFANEWLNAEKQATLNYVNSTIGSIQVMHSSMSGIASQYYTNKSIELDNDYQKQKDKIEKSTMDEEKKQVALEKLDKKFEKKRRKLAREQAKSQKAIAIIGATINTAQSVTKALAQGGFFGGPAFAAVVGALGAAQVALIASQPLPKAEKGGVIKGSSGGTALIAGEKGKSEAIIPLDDPESQRKLGGIGGGVNISIQNFYATGDSDQMAIEFDRAMYKLYQDGNSQFAEAIE